MDTQLKLQKILKSAVEQGASDVHLSVGHPPIFRKSQVLEKQKGPVLSPEDTEIFARELLGERTWKEFLEKKEFDWGYEGEGFRFRINIFFQRDRISIAARLIPSQIKTLEELNLPPVLYRITKAQQGLVLVTGPSSQGKSTTLASIIDTINHTRSEHIITIEDPIEYVFEDDKSLIEQREVGKDTRTFAGALRSALRQDPDVIMVGEMRDLETISTAITAAETGHLVLTTLHTNSAAQSIHRIIDVFPSTQQNQIRAQLSSSLLAVISQRLLPSIKGGLVPACEIMFSTPAIANLIRENRIHEIPAIIETSREEGMVLMNKSLQILVEEGKVAREVALRYSLNPKDLAARLPESY